MSETLGPRSRKVKILATLGPASGTPDMIRQLMLAGADAFRINMSHGDQQQKAELVDAIRALEKEFKRPTTILLSSCATGTCICASPVVGVWWPIARENPLESCAWPPAP